MAEKFKLKGLDCELLKLYELRLSDTKIADKINVCSESIRQWRLRNNLPPNGRIPCKICELKSSIIKEEEFLKLYNSGFKDKKIANLLKVSPHTVFNFRKSMGLSPVEKYKHVILSDFQYQVLLGHTIGDGHLRLPNGSVNASGKMEHSQKQKDYFLWKFNILKDLTNSKYSEYDRINKDNGKTYKSITTYLPAHPILTELYKITYINNVKEVNKNNLLHFNEVALATLFMDDGSKGGNCYTIAMNALSKDALNEFKNMLYYRFKIKSWISKEGVVHIIENRSKLIFENLVGKYIIKSMQYKLHNVVPVKSDELLENPEEDNQQPSL